MEDAKNHIVAHSKCGQVGLLIVFAFVDLLAATVVSLQAPFYPEVASGKGASASEYGLVFGIFELTAIFASLIFGTQISVMGPKRVFISGIFVTGFSTIVFGRLNGIEKSSHFIWSSMGVRVVEAIGETAYLTASFTLVAAYFPKNIATSIAILETCYGVGMIIGPSLGGVLYDAGGYSLPFMVMGGLLCTSSFFALLVIRMFPMPQQKEVGGTLGVKPTAMFHLMAIPEVCIAAYGIVSTATGMGFISALLEPHLRQFELTKSNVGFVFILCGGVYAITAPLWGWICDHFEQPQTVSLMGILCGISGYFLIGPVVFLPLDTTLWMSCVGLGLFGLGLSAVYVSSFTIMLSSAITSGYPDDLSTYGLVSGLWTCMVCVGYFVGPTLGGVLEDFIGFRKGSAFVLIALFVHVLILGIRLFHKRRASCKLDKDEKKCQDPVEYCP